jgi:23S rRNA-/tRNA-specific pseudouridylate synthase
VGKFNRIQMTPDIMPSDIVGFDMIDKNTGEYTYKAGAAYCNFLLADEINRASPKSQSALLEVMEEQQISLDGKTIKQFLFGEMKLTRAQVTALKLDPVGILYNGEHATVRCVLKQGDVLEIALGDRESDVNREILPVKLDFQVVFEDEYMLIVNKPFGMPVHPSYNHRDDSLANGIAHYYLEKGIVATFRAVNRLDRDTSGLVVVAKDRMTANRLCKSFAQGEVEKSYFAQLDGRLENACPSSICEPLCSVELSAFPTNTSPTWASPHEFIRFHSDDTSATATDVMVMA